MPGGGGAPRQPEGSRADASTATCFAVAGPAAKAPPDTPQQQQQQAATSKPPANSKDKPATDVVAGAMARAASQSTIHPIDTLKVRLQSGRSRTGGVAGIGGSAAGAASTSRPSGLPALQHTLSEFASLYKGVLGAATGAGIIIGSYFAFYSNTKKLLRERTTLPEGSVAFISGATAAVGSSIVKVPIAVCIRSVQAGVYPNAIHAAKSILSAAGVRGLFTGFLPTLLEDVPDMAVKFTVYEMMRTVHVRLCGEQPSTWQDLVMGGTAGAAAAAATTPLDCVKTRMMCTASTRPTIMGAVRSILADNEGWRAFFKGVGPRAISNGLNSAIFFCFFEAIRRVLLTWQQDLQARRQQQQQQQGPAAASASASSAAPPPAACVSWSRASRSIPAAMMGQGHWRGSRGLDHGGLGGRSMGLACLSIAIPVSCTVLS